MPEQRAARRRVAGVSGPLLLGLGAFLASGGHPAPPAPGVEMLSGFGGSGDSGNGLNQGGGNDKKAFAIAGRVAGLMPGETRPLVLTLSHRNNFPIDVTAVSVRVADAGSGCPAAHVSVSRFAGPVRVPANGSATRTVGVTLSAGAPDACKSVAWPFAYAGTAVKP